VDENWTQIYEFPDYSVSTYGRVRKDHTGRIITLQRNQQGNVFATLYLAGKHYSAGVARLMMHAFLDNPFPEARFCATPLHVDGDLSNNYVENLAVRPRWYSIVYQRQFPLGEPEWYGEIFEVESGREFRDSQDAMFSYGLLERSIFLSVANRDTPYYTLLNYRFQPKM
jgi:NUMOD4 motif